MKSQELANRSFVFAALAEAGGLTGTAAALRAIGHAAWKEAKLLHDVSGDLAKNEVSARLGA